jgi:hypothetical protein
MGRVMGLWDLRDLEIVMPRAEEQAARALSDWGWRTMTSTGTCGAKRPVTVRRSPTAWCIADDPEIDEKGDAYD